PLDGPTIVCAQAGNVNTGAFDPVGEISDIAHERGAWVHVDGAFGLWAATAPARAHLFRGVERADSWATDGHKWLNVPYDSGIAIVRDHVAHKTAMTGRASYLVQSSGAERDPQDWTPEFSRRARGFAVYAALKSLGRDGVTALVERCCRLARRMADRLAGGPGVRILNEVVLNQVLVRFEAPGAGGDAEGRREHGRDRRRAGARRGGRGRGGGDGARARARGHPQGRRRGPDGGRRRGGRDHGRGHDPGDGEVPDRPLRRGAGARGARRRFRRRE